MGTYDSDDGEPECAPDMARVLPPRDGLDLVADDLGSAPRTAASRARTTYEDVGEIDGEGSDSHYRGHGEVGCSSHTEHATLGRPVAKPREHGETREAGREGVEDERAGEAADDFGQDADAEAGKRVAEVRGGAGGGAGVRVVLAGAWWGVGRGKDRRGEASSVYNGGQRRARG